MSVESMFNLLEVRHRDVVNGITHELEVTAQGFIDTSQGINLTGAEALESACRLMSNHRKKF